MNRPTVGPVLLLGEGDFSLSVALNKQLPGTPMMSSAFLNEKDIGVHRNALENIETLRSNGVLVHLGVDATNLTEDDRINKTNFSRIIFNFPHIGGKSNIKRNRELLKLFFHSAVKYLTEDGDICVSLCRGQGGTPADVPIREWADSWQVVAMAAYSDLVLVDTVPFVAKDFPEYSCTGFRSRDQFFHTEGAVTHIFQKLAPERLPSDTICSREITLDGNTYYTNSYVTEALSKMREILSLDYHPLKATSRYIEEVVAQGFEDVFVEDMKKYPYVVPMKEHNNELNFIVHKTKPCQPQENVQQAATICADPSNHKYFKPCDSSSQIIRCDACATEDKYTNETKGGKMCAMYSRNNRAPSDTYLLRCNLLESMLQTDCFSCETSDRVTVVKGDTYHRCNISPHDTPQHFEMILWQRTSTSNFKNIMKISLESIFSSKNVTFEISETTDQSDEHYPNVDTDCMVYTYDKKEQQSNLSCNENSDAKQMSGKSDILLNTEQTSIESMPCVYLGSLKSDPSVQLCICFVDIIYPNIHDLSDSRLIWSRLPRLLSQFTEKSLNLVKPISLYPPEWKHDISFWHDSTIDFDELTYMDVVRDHLGDCVKEVKLMNIWTPQGQMNTSRCYRQLYQPCDQAVSYHRAHEFQRLLRLKVAHVLKIELR